MKKNSISFRLSNSILFQKDNIRKLSSDDEQIENENEGTYPLFYMLPNKNYPQFQRKYLINKLQILIQLHKKEETNLYKRKIGWNVLYSYFFQKLFLVSKSIRENNKFINLKEVEIRIRKQIGKIGQRKKNNDENDKSYKEPYFDLFEKIQYNPPVSSLFSHNFIKESSNLFLGNNENSKMTQILNTFTNSNKKKIKDPIVRNVQTFSQKKEKTQDKKIKLDKLRRKSNIEIKRFDIIESKKENKLLEEVDLHLKQIIQNNNKQKIFLNQNFLSKGTKKIIDKFIKKFPTTSDIVKDELNFLQKDQKAYEIEIKNSKMFENKVLDGKRYLFDFHYLKGMLSEDDKIVNFNFKKEIDSVIKQIDNAIDGTISIFTND